MKLNISITVKDFFSQYHINENVEVIVVDHLYKVYARGKAIELYPLIEDWVIESYDYFRSWQQIELYISEDYYG